MTLTIVAVFLPIAFTGGLIGRFMNSFGLVVSIAVLISLVEAMTFAPMLSAYLFKQQEPKYEPDGDEFEAEYSGAMGWLDRGYHKVLGWTLSHRAVTLIVSVAILVLSLYRATHLKPAFMPSVDQGIAGIDLILPPGTALSETDTYAQQRGSAPDERRHGRFGAWPASAGRVRRNRPASSSRSSPAFLRWLSWTPRGPT